MIEYQSDHFADLLSLFGSMDFHLSIAGVLTGEINGRAWANENTTSALVMSPQGFLFGGAPDVDFLAECKSLLRDELLPQRVTNGELDYVIFYPEGWRSAAETALKDLDPLADTRMTWGRTLKDVSAKLPDGIQPVTPELLTCKDLKGLDWILGEISESWRTPEEFCRRGFGAVATVCGPDGERIIGWCLTDWVVGDRCELGVEVAVEYRLRGHGLRVVRGALALAASRGLAHAGWQCWSSNEGSQALARAAGFRIRAEYPVLFGWNHPLDNSLINGNYYLNDHPGVSVFHDYRRAAESYAKALDKGWDWHGNALLYYNAACLFCRSGEPGRARLYMQSALEKGFAGIEAKRGTWEWQYTYHEDDAEELMEIMNPH